MKCGTHTFRTSTSRNFNQLSNFNLLYHSAVRVYLSLFLKFPYTVNEILLFQKPTKSMECVLPSLSTSAYFPTEDKRFPLRRSKGPISYCLMCLSEVLTFPNYVLYLEVSIEQCISKYRRIKIKQWNIKINHSNSYLNVVIWVHRYLFFQRKA